MALFGLWADGAGPGQVGWAESGEGQEWAGSKGVGVVRNRRRSREVGVVRGGQGQVIWNWSGEESVSSAQEGTWGSHLEGRTAQPTRSVQLETDSLANRPPPPPGNR